MPNADILSTQELLCQELDEIEKRRQRRVGIKATFVHDDLETHEQRAQRLQLAALCLSGGGIRSAAFCLGVLQALATKRMLRQFDYLSTVSGGGFIGGWLQVLIRESGGVGGAEDTVAQMRPHALQQLRAYTNYLTPQTGPFSTDTWAGIVLYARNLLINWAVFAPLFLLLTLIPIVYRTAISACNDCLWMNVALLVCAGLTLLGSVIGACSLLPSHRPPWSLADPTPSYASVSAIRWRVVYPAFAWTLLIPWLLDFATVPLSGEIGGISWFAHNADWSVPIFYFVLTILGFCVAWWLQSNRVNPGIRLFRANFNRWILATTGAALLTWVMLRVGASVLPLKHPVARVGEIDTATALSVVAPLGLAVVYVLQTALYVALRRETELADLDREWLGRANAMILRLTVGWTIFALGCLILPLLLEFVEPNAVTTSWSGGRISLMGAITVGVGGVAAWLGKIWSSVEELAESPAIWSRLQAYLPVILGVLFAACLLVVFGGVLHFVLAHFQIAVGKALGLRQVIDQPKWLPLILQCLVGATLFTGIMTFRHVNVNRFSMHAVYRNRLTRAFLGSARNKRKQDPFTGFDPQDNTPLSSLLGIANSLFPVINTTLNITSSTNTASAERKAASFIATPLACGSAALRHPTQTATDVNPYGAFVPTTRFAGLETLKHPTSAIESGPGVGSVLTVSGAAVSPNWGYHSSRITAFLMTLFNVRLGIWLPNPSKATPDELRLARPRNSLMALIDEMLGQTTDDSQAIYLSDGGHFENLGVYEMFRRRSSLIVVVDAGSDEACSLSDLGNAIRKAEIDFGMTVLMRQPINVHARTRLEADEKLTATALGFAFGDVDYGGGHHGRLLYVKPSFLPQIPTEVRAYGAEHTSFPHEPTFDQWFSESQFESYRMLGRHQMAAVLDAAQPGNLLDMFNLMPVTGQEVPADAPDSDGTAKRPSIISDHIRAANSSAESQAAE